MTCTPDNKTKFETEQDYTVRCEACNLFVKLYKYRSCEERFEWNAKQGVDVFQTVKEIEKLSGSLPAKPAKVSKEKKDPNKQNRRGR